MTRNVKKMLCDYHIPTHERDTLPFFYYRDTLVFIPYLPYSDLLREWQATTEETYRINVFKLGYENKNE